MLYKYYSVICLIIYFLLLNLAIYIDIQSVLNGNDCHGTIMFLFLTKTSFHCHFDPFWLETQKNEPWWDPAVNWMMKMRIFWVIMSLKLKKAVILNRNNKMQLQRLQGPMMDNTRTWIQKKNGTPQLCCFQCPLETFLVLCLAIDLQAVKCKSQYSRNIGHSWANRPNHFTCT